MTGTAPAAPAASAAQPARDDLTARLFRALYQGFDLHTAGGTYIVVPAGTLYLAGRSLGDIARQISDHQHPAPPAPGAPAETRPAS